MPHVAVVTEGQMPRSELKIRKQSWYTHTHSPFYWPFSRWN